MRNKKSIKKVGGYSDPFGVQDIFKPKQYPPVYQAKNTMYAGVEPKVQATSDQLWGNVDADEQDNKFNSTPSYLRPQATYGMIGPPEPIQPNYGPIGPFETRYDNGLRNDCPAGQKWSEEDQRCMDDNGYDPAQHEEKNKPSRDPLSIPKTGPGTGVNPNSQLSPAAQSRKNAFDPTLYLRGAQAGLTWLGNKMEMNRQDQYTRENIAKLGQPNAMPVDNYQPNYYNLYAKYGGKVKMQKGGFNMPPAVGDNTRLPLPIDPNAIPLPQGTNPNVTVYATKDKTTSDYLNTLTHKNFTRDYPLVPGENIPEVNSFEEFNPDYYQDTWQAWLQNGKPRIRPLDSSKEGRSYYRPPANQIQRLFNKNGTNEMHLNYKKTKFYAVRDAYLAELAHAQQTKMGIYSKDHTKWQTKAEYDEKAYSDPTAHEYQAHQIIEPKLRQRYENRHSLISPSKMDSLVNANYSFQFGEFTEKDQENLLNKKLGRLKYQDGGAIKDYYKQYMNSPMYKKMNEGKQDFTSERTSQLNKLTTKLVPQSQIADNFRASNPGVDIKNSQMQGYYNFNDSTINLNNKRDFRGRLPRIDAHEWSHGTDKGGQYIPQQDIDMLKSSDPNFGASEGRALLNQTRWEAKKSGMYDPFTQPFKSEYLQDKKNNGLRNLKKQYSDDQILNLMNSVSSADTKSLPIAQGGGQIEVNPDTLYFPKGTYPEYLRNTNPDSTRLSTGLGAEYIPELDESKQFVKDWLRSPAALKRMKNLVKDDKLAKSNITNANKNIDNTILYSDTKRMDDIIKDSPFDKDEDKKFDASLKARAIKLGTLENNMNYINATIRGGNVTKGFYSPNGQVINITQEYAKDSNTPKEVGETIVHELSHASNLDKLMKKYTPRPSYDDLNPMLKLLPFRNMSNSAKAAILSEAQKLRANKQSDRPYIEQDGFYPRIMQMRYKSNVKPNEIITPDRYEKIKSENKDSDLYRYFDDKDVQWMLNNFVKNGENKLPQAQKGGVASTSDSLRVYNAQVAQNAYYDKNSKYFTNTIRPFTERETQNDPFIKNNTEASLNTLRAIYKGITNKGSGWDELKGARKYSGKTDAEIVANLNNQFKQMKSSDNNVMYYTDLVPPVLDPNAPVAVWDKRIKPRSIISRKPTVEDFPGNAIATFDYDPIAVKPYNMLTPAEKIIRDKKYPRSVNKLKSVTKPIPPPPLKGGRTPMEKILNKVNRTGIKPTGYYPVEGFAPAFKKPVQPIVYQPEPKDYPIVTRPKTQVRGTISGGDMSPDTSSTGDPIFGPTQSLIGHWKDGQFYSADGAQGKVNQADVDLLKDPVALNKYLKSKGLPVKKMGGFNRGKK